MAEERVVFAGQQEFVARGAVEREKVELLRELREGCLADRLARLPDVRLVNREPCRCVAVPAPQKARGYAGISDNDLAFWVMMMWFGGYLFVAWILLRWL